MRRRAPGRRLAAAAVEHCQTPMKVPCGELETYRSLGACARRALTLRTGEWERDAEKRP